MTSHSPFDFAKPYELMVGYWAGIATVFNAEGVYQDSIQSRVAIYWHVPHKLLHFRQDEEDSVEALLNGSGFAKDDVTAVRNFSQQNFDLKVEEKVCSGKDYRTGTLVSGVETRPGVYMFNLKTRNASGEYFADYYNNQYFVGPNERQIIGPYVIAAPATKAALTKFSPSRKASDVHTRFPTGTTRFVIAQAFTRIAYDVPKNLKRRHGWK
jgi:hypothetical protein